MPRTNLTAVFSLAAVALLVPNLARASIDCSRGFVEGSWGVADPIARATHESTCRSYESCMAAQATGCGTPGSSGLASGNTGSSPPTSGFSGNSKAGPAGTTPPPPAASAAAATTAAASVSTMTGTTHDSQGHMQGTTKQLTTSGSSSSRSVGTMDIVEALLILPFNPSRAGKLLTSGQQAHEAAGGLDAMAAKAQQNTQLMQGTPNLGGAVGQQGSGSAGNNSGVDSSGASGVMSSERAGELFGKFEEKFGIGKDDIVQEVNRVKGDPEAVGTFMHELTGDKSVGKEAVGNALDAYAAELGIGRADLFRQKTGDLAANETPAKPSKQQPTAPVADPAQAEAERKLASVKEKEAKESLRDRARRLLAERKAGRGGNGEGGPVETLQPIRDQFFETIKAEQDKELSLFDVIRAKYAEKRAMLERAPGAPSQ